jgi:hypothetical protein
MIRQHLLLASAALAVEAMSSGPVFAEACLPTISELNDIKSLGQPRPFDAPARAMQPGDFKQPKDIPVEPDRSKKGLLEPCKQADLPMIVVK